MARRRLDPAERHGELLEQALLQFATRPYEEVTVADVAERAGASEGLVYRYFDDKRSLYLEAIEAGLARAADAVDPGDPALPPTERFEIGLAAYLDLVEGYPYLIPHLLQGGPAADEQVQSLVARAYDRVADRIIDRMGVRNPPQRLSRAVRLWLGFVQFSATQWLHQNGSTREELMSTQITTFRALAAEALGIDPTPSPPDAPPPLIP